MSVAASKNAALAGLLLLQVLLLQYPLSAIGQPLTVDEPITYSHYYVNEDVRANPCKVVHNVIKPGVGTVAGIEYVPFVGTSLARDSQLLLSRLYHSTEEYPVKQFVVVVPQRALDPPQGAMWYQLQHLKEYGDNVMIIACRHTPTVAEGWNAVFQTTVQEPWGVYCARDTHWMPGSLKKLAGHMWNASRDGSIETALFGWTYPMAPGQYNAFAMTRSAVNRFGLFDENIYPSFFEDNDFQIRQQRMNPPMKVQELSDVILHHGSPKDTHYKSSIVHTTDHEHDEKHIRDRVNKRWPLNSQYLSRKWGCRGEQWSGCEYRTPFNKSLPVWYWYTSRHQRILDYGLTSSSNKLFDADGNVLYEIPTTFAGWVGYNDTAHTCRLTGPIGVVNRTEAGVWCI